jgi:hypothetical protein
MSPVKYELGFYIPEDGILHSHRRQNLRSYGSLSDPLAFCCRWSGRKRPTVVMSLMDAVFQSRMMDEEVE